MTAPAHPLRFELIEGGPLYRIGQRLGLSPGSRGLVQLSLLLAALTWVPLFVLNAIQGNLGGGATVPFAWSLGTHVRFLVAIPLFFAAEACFDTRGREALGHVLDSQLVMPAEEARFGAALRDAMRWRGSTLVEVTLVAVTIGLILSGVRSDLPVEVRAGGPQPSGPGAASRRRDGGTSW